MDNAQRERVHDDLRGLVKGEVYFDDLHRSLYSTDASIFQIQPLGIVVPRDEADVQAVVRYAAEHRLPLVPRGAGSGLAGEALGTGIVLDLSRHFRDLVAIGTDWVRVQPGVVHRNLNATLARIGRRFAPDPASGAQCTIGGMVATNASGSRALRHGYTRDHLLGLRLVLDSSDAVAVARESRWPGPHPTSGRLADVVSSVATLLDRNAEVIQASRPVTPFNRCGYLLDGVLRDDSVDLPRLLAGSEGTLALFTEATLRTVPLPLGHSLVLLGFPGLESALRAVQRVLPTNPAACELLDQRLLTLARGDASIAPLVSAGVEAVLLVEYEADSQAEARTAAADLAGRLLRSDRLAIHARSAVEPEEIERLWSLREAALPSLYGLRGRAQPVPFIEDIGVPPAELAAFLPRLQEILQHHETTASFLIHAGAGQVHARLFLDLQKPEDAAKLWAIADEAYALVLGVGGTISAQHGTGLARTPWVARQYPRLHPVFRELKAIFDPLHLFNPGKILGPDLTLPAWPLRGREALRSTTDSASASPPEAASVNGSPSSPANPPTGAAELPLPGWAPGQMHAESSECNGCASCRTEAPGQRMCPIFRASHDEAATPRAKANLLRALLQNGDTRALSGDDVRSVADLCVNCKMCARECPAHVDIPRLMLAAKAANVAEHGMKRADWTMARLESFARLGSAFAPLTNRALASYPARWALETFFGVSRQRRLPRFAIRSFLRLARRRGWSRRPVGRRPRVAYFVDLFANYNDPAIAQATVAVLHHNGFEVYVPPGQCGCGMAPLAHGDVETAREAITHNLRIFADLAREGYTILCSEPTAAVMLCSDSLNLIDDPDVKLVAERVVELTTFLGQLHGEGRLRQDFRPLEFAVGHHVPCHLKALGRPPAGPDLLALIPRMRVHTIDVGCSGMAGTFGLQAGNYEVSLEAGRSMLEELAGPRVLFGSTECSSCRMQMEDRTGKRTLHPVEYLALAYGFLPELRRRLTEPIGDLVL